MINAPYEKEFVFQDGRRAKNILELSDVIERLSLQEFQSFVNPSKNDFANWTEYVLFDKRLSEKLRGTISQDQTVDLLKGKLKEISEEQDSVTKAAMSTSTIKILKQSEPILYSARAVHEAPAGSSHESPHTLRDVSSAHHQEPSAKNRWFEFFKMDVSKKKIEKTAAAESDKSRPERELKEQEVENKSENMLWIVLYSLLIGLILILLVYKFFFMA